MDPHIGITGFTSFDQVKRMLEVYCRFKPAFTSRLLHVGVMMSRKTLRDLPTQFGRVFPHKSKIADVFASTEAYNCLHYADYDNVDLRDCLVEAIGYGGSNMHSVQLDMTWPDPDDVREALAVNGRPVDIILQIGRESMKQVDHNPQKLVRRLGLYDGVVNRVLLDMSMGRGVEMNSDFLAPYIEAIKDRLPEVGVGVAGGLGPDTMAQLVPFIAKYPDLSFDAQSRLTPNNSILDPVDWVKATDYLEVALQLCGK